MKKHYAILIVFILALNPILASATVSDSDDNPQPTQVNNSENESIPQPNNAPQEPEPVIDDSTPVPLNNDNDVPEISKDTTEPNTSNTTDTTNDDLPKTDPPEEGDDAKEPSDAEADTDGTKTDVEIETDAEKSEDEEDAEEKVHVHSFKYTGNKDGTHTVTCTEAIEADDDSDEEAATKCSYEEIESCEYNEDGICIYCGDKKPDEEEEFAPSMSFSISNQSFTMGGPNPVVSVNISQDDYDIEYAQVCFANYGNNQFINVGLAQGKYFDFKTNEFVYTNNNSWSASCDITSDYSSGTYKLRSIYVRSTTGETIHYSVESDSLPEEYQNIDISLNMEATQFNNNGTIDETLLYIPAFNNETAVEEYDSSFREEEKLPVLDIATPEVPAAIQQEEITISTPSNENKTLDKAEIQSTQTSADEPKTASTSKDIVQTTKEAINDSIDAEEKIDSSQSIIPPQQKEATKVTTKEPAKDEKNDTQNKEQQAPAPSFFDSFLNFMKNMFKWW